MLSDDAGAAHDATPENLGFRTEEWDGGLVRPGPDRDVRYPLLNLSVAPFDGPDLRRALAQCTDREGYIAFRAPDHTLAAGPFAEGSLGHVADPGYPAFDPDAGRALLDEIGRPDVVTYSTTNTPAGLVTAELFQEMWSTNCDLNVEIDRFEQSELITRALTGNFGVMLWRNHGRGHPALEIRVWHSRHAEGLAINTGRLVDPRLDELLFDALATDDRDEIDAIGQEITGRFADHVYTIWLDTNEWSIAHQPDVMGAGTLTLPSGSRTETSTLGVPWLSEAWIDG